jgi:hypothetical protein
VPLSVFWKCIKIWRLLVSQTCQSVKIRHIYFLSQLVNLGTFCIFELFCVIVSHCDTVWHMPWVSHLHHVSHLSQLSMKGLICVTGDLLVANFNKVWVVGGGWERWAKSYSKAFGRLLCSLPKAKTKWKYLIYFLMNFSWIVSISFFENNHQWLPNSVDADRFAR